MSNICSTKESCKEYLFKIFNKNKSLNYFFNNSSDTILLKQFDDLLMESFQNNGKDLFFILQIIDNTFDTQKNEFYFMKYFFTKYITSLSNDEIELRIIYYIQYNCIVLIHYASIFNLFQLFDVSKFIPYAIQNGEPTIIKILNYELNITNNDNIIKDNCKKINIDSIVSVPIQTFKIDIIEFDNFSPEILNKDTSSLFKNTTSLVYDLNINNYSIGIESILQRTINFDFEWLKSSNEYLTKLSKYDLFSIKGYTFLGDGINSYIRNYKNKNLNITSESILEMLYLKNIGSSKTIYYPYFFQIREIIRSTINTDIKTMTNLTQQDIDNILDDNLQSSYEFVYKLIINKTIKPEPLFWSKVLDLYLNDLIRIINNSPPIPKEISVYRGTSTHYYPKKIGSLFTHVTFMSTTFNSQIVDKFSINPCCIIEIKLKPGSHGLFLDPITSVKGEAEILLPPNLNFIIEDKKVIKYTQLPSYFKEKYNGDDLKPEDFVKNNLVKKPNETNLFMKQSFLCSDSDKERVDYTLMRQI